MNKGDNEPDYNMPGEKDLDKYEKETPLEEIDLLDTDVKINPDFYIHLCIIRLINSPMAQDITTGFSRFILLSEQLESLCSAADMLPEDYHEKIKEYENSENVKRIEKDLLRNMKVASYKTRLIYGIFFKKKPLTGSLVFRG